MFSKKKNKFTKERATADPTVSIYLGISFCQKSLKEMEFKLQIINDKIQ